MRMAEQTKIEGSLTLRGLTKRFDDFTAVDHIDLDVRPGELLALLGPSGCGKTTTLRMVAGLERPTEGEIRFADRVLFSRAEVIEVPTSKRNVGMVFQSYALWPHMTVFENVAYPLRLRRVAKAEIRQRVHEVLGLMNLDTLASHTIPQLSGGQQQRVALARALVYQPSLMLFDEPFSNLDAHLRMQMRLELKYLRRKVSMTGMFVTHDQVEALSVADSVAIMNGGKVEQIGTPREVYLKPRTRFVRDFLGRVVSLHGSIESRDGTSLVCLGDGRTKLECLVTSEINSGLVEISVRPEHTKVHAADNLSRPNTVPAIIEELLFTGDQFEARLGIAGESILIELPANREWREGESLALELPKDALSLWRSDKVAR
jgi:ABC-type Fe3+/spermidine/putrescine transport system ATPase subunit